MEKELLEKLNKWLTRPGQCPRPYEVEFWNSGPLETTWATCVRADWMLPVININHKGTDKFADLLRLYAKQSAKLCKGTKDAEGNSKKPNFDQVSAELCDFVRQYYQTPL